VVPRRHVASYFDVTPEERQALWDMVERARKWLREKHHPDGFNLGVNVGESAGQTVMHLHIHVIPRYQGDMEDPRGGVRGVIPGKQQYGRKETE
jgi:diadenosine tetraphosphate (Ap4A) HIT family hydrolase